MRFRRLLKEGHPSRLAWLLTKKQFPLFKKSLAAIAVFKQRIGVSLSKSYRFCKRYLGAHKSVLLLTGGENKVDLILSRASMFAPPRNVNILNICPRHRESLGLGWRRPTKCKCSVPNDLSRNSAKPRERPKDERGITEWMSQHILRETGILVPVGSGTIDYEQKLRVRI